MTTLETAPSDIDTPGQDDQFHGWRARWTSRRRRYFAVILPTDAAWDRQPTEITEPVLILSKPGRKTVEVKGQSDIDRPVMLARGMTSAMLCDAHFAREWGDLRAVREFTGLAETWHTVAKLRTNANAVQRAGARMIAGSAGAGAKGAE